jgi:hypothetical protein
MYTYVALPCFCLMSAINSRNTRNIHFLELKDRVETHQHKTWLPRLLMSLVNQSVTKFHRENWLNFHILSISWRPS